MELDQEVMVETAYFAKQIREPFCNPRQKFPPETDVAETEISRGLNAAST